MTPKKKGSVVWILLAILSFGIALLAGAGLILAGDTAGRVIYAVLWSAIGLSWVARYGVSGKRRRAD